MRVAITGGTGMIGTWLARALRERGDHVLIVTRSPPEEPGDVQWTPSRGVLDVGRLGGLDAVVNLTGAPIADRPWTAARRRVLVESRIDATDRLVESLARLDDPPRAFVGVAGLGRFGDGGETILDDDAPVGTGFLADLANSWEHRQLEAGEELGCRAAVLRMSICLSPTGGVFPLMVTPFRLGIGGWLGNGRQYTSWISVRDAVGAFLHLIDHEACVGGFNGTVPEPSRNKEWCKALGRAVKRPVLTHAPKWALRGALGELADDLFLASLRCVPRKLLSSGYEFQDPLIEPTFVSMLEQLDGDEQALIERMPRRRRKRIQRRRGRSAPSEPTPE